MAKQIDSTYGDALFELAVEQGKEEAILEELNSLIQILDKEEDLLHLLVHPEVTGEDKLKMMKNIFEGKLSDAVMGTLYIIVKNDRSSDMISILNYVVRRIKKHRNIGAADVTSAFALSEAQQIGIEERLVATTGYDKIEATYHVDSSLIGGLVIRIEDRVVDSSIKHQLDTMSKHMANA